MSACPECGGNLRFDPNHKRYVCLSCGLAVTREEIDDIRNKNLKGNPTEEKERQKKDYLKWWSNKK
jgi:transcription initiation factor TFIIIB Brf1 subunit/transcription initiation factor TFIIB